MLDNLRTSYATTMRTSLVAIALSGCGKVPFTDESFGAIAACEEKLTKGLVSPSSYKRISATYNTTDFSFEDYWEKQGGDACRPYTDGECEDTTKLLRAMSAKNWLLSKNDIKAGKDTIQIFDQNMYKPFPKSTTKQKLRADREYLEWSYNLGYGKGKPEKHPAAIVSIKYDAVNSFNAPLRSTQICRFPPTRDEKYSTYDIY
ncbi:MULTISPECIES: hypothetical protein [unclassified Sphingomonas]|uniref:hypothetical protein n=1 Tax=unclassified Sphingomonas TaxID=196159 RepID=UPI0012E25522|nr:MULTISPECIES: hypothetical protein [unclassified Sphingomonas]